MMIDDQHLVSCTWIEILEAELKYTSLLICNTMDTCSECLAYWRDMKERTFRLKGIHALRRQVPDLSGLEDFMNTYITILGDIQIILQNLRISDQHVQKGKKILVHILKVPASFLFSDRVISVSYVQKNLGNAIQHFENSQIHSGIFSKLSLCIYCWPEVLAISAISIATTSAIVSGGLTIWLQHSSISRRASTRNNIRSVSNISAFSWEGIKLALGNFRDKIFKWLNKKILNHVTSPTQNLVNELLNFDEFEAKISVFNKNDAEDLAYTEARLSHLYSEHTSSATEGQVINISSISSDYEDIARRPLRFLFSWPSVKFLRPVLINFYFVKAETLYVMKAMDYLYVVCSFSVYFNVFIYCRLKGTNFTFELFAIAPALMFLSILVNKLVRYSTETKRDDINMILRLRFIFRDLEQLLNRFEPSHAPHVGRFIVLKHQLQETLKQQVIWSVSNTDRNQIDFLLNTLDPFRPDLLREVASVRDFLDDL